MSKPKRLSIIIPALNECEVLPEALIRLQAFRERGHQIVLVDGGSTDSTVEVARPLVDEVVPTSRGRAHQMNEGARVASGDVLLFLHADTLLPERCDRVVLSALDGLGWGRFDVEFSHRRWSLKLVASAMNWRSRLTGIATGDQAIFVARTLFETVGGFPAIPLMEDVALCRQLRAIERPVCLRERVVTSSRRWISGGVVRTILVMWGLRLGYVLGADPRRLHRIYTRS